MFRDSIWDGNWGLHPPNQTLAGWLTARPNLVAWLAMFVSLVVLAGALLGDAQPRARAIVAIAAIAVAATWARYLQLAVAAYRDGADRLSRPAVRWWFIGCGEVVAAVVATFVLALT